MTDSEGPHSHGAHGHAHSSDAPRTASNQGHGHSQNQGHGHSHAWNGPSEGIRFAFFLNFSFSVLELVGGLWIGSFAIMAGAIHDVGDAASLGVAWFLEGYANRTSDQSFNFGYRRFSLLSALIAGIIIAAGNALILFECSVKIFYLATGMDAAAVSQTPQSTPMMAIALVGLATNGWAAYRLSQGQTQSERILTWHSIEDILGWTVVLTGGIILHFVSTPWLDPVLALLLAIFVTYNILRHLKTTVYLFLQGRPPGFNEAHFVQEVLALDGVDHIDHLAVWSLDGESAVLSARLHLHSTHEPREIELIKDRVRGFASAQNAKATIETCLMEKEDSKGGPC